MFADWSFRYTIGSDGLRSAWGGDTETFSAWEVEVSFRDQNTIPYSSQIPGKWRVCASHSATLYDTVTYWRVGRTAVMPARQPRSCACQAGSTVQQTYGALYSSIMTAP